MVLRIKQQEINILWNIWPYPSHRVNSCEHINQIKLIFFFSPSHLGENNKNQRGLRWWYSGWGSSRQCGGTRLRSLAREDSTCLGATKSTRHNCWALQAARTELGCPEPALHSERGRRNETPACGGKSSPHSLQREKACAATKTRHSQKQINNT